MKFSAIVATVIVLAAFTESMAQELEFHPSLAVSEEFTDNVFNTVNDEEPEYITRVLPGFSLGYRAKALDVTARYTFDYRHYARGSRGDEITHSASAKGLLTVVENFFFIDASDDYRRVSLDVARDFTRESLFVNQSDLNVATISPYFLWHLGPRTTMRTGYRYVNTWYREPTGVDKTEHTGFVDLSRELGARLNLDAGYTFTRLDTKQTDYDRHQGFAGIRYEYAEGSTIRLQGGMTSFDFSDGSSFTGPFWNAGIIHVLDSLTFRADATVIYTEDPLRTSTEERLYSGRVEKRFERGEGHVSFAYSELEDTITEEDITEKYTVGLGGGYEFTERFKSTIELGGERFSRDTSEDFPYRAFATVGLSYDLGDSFMVSLLYSHVSDFRHGSFDSPDFGAQTNRVMLEFRKVF